MSIEKHDPWALLAEARDSVERDMDYTEIPDQVSREHQRLLNLRARIDAALAARDTKPNPADFMWQEKETNRHGISPHEADYSDDVFLTVEKHWLGEQWLFRVEYVGEAENEAEAKAKAIEYAGRLP